jgi:hypothetical protein
VLHLFQWAPSPRRLRRAGVCLCLCLVLTIAGCSYSGPARPYTLPQLHIPQLQWLQALSRIPTADGTHGGVISALTTFEWPGTSIPHVILNLNSAFELSGLDGTGTTPLPMGAPCYSSPAAVTADGSWIGCVSFPDNTNGDNRLQVAALSPTGTSQVHQIQVSPEPFYNNLAWSLDGQYLAVVLSDVGQGCDVEIFSSPPPHTAFTHAVTLTAAPFSNQQGFCQVDSLVWPSDGQKLFVLGTDSGTGPFLATVPVLPLLQAFANSSPEHVVTQTVSSGQVQALAIDTQLVGQWLLTPQADTLFYTTTDSPEQFMSLNLRTKQAKTLFTFPGTFQNTYQINALALLPNGRQLLLVIGGHPCTDCGRYAVSDVYLYSLDTPASALTP